MSGAALDAALLDVSGLTIRLPTGAPLVQDLSLRVGRGETLALVGESGCGKSMTALAVMGLLPPGVAIGAGRIRFEGTDLAGLDETALSDLRGKRLAMIFQEPMTSLNPVLRIGEQIEEVIDRHERVSRAAARERSIALLERVRVPDPASRMRAYPHELSGGQRQRVMIAMALACSPALLIADEPTTALDVTTQAEILRLLRELQASSGLALLLISHDLGVVGQMADRILIMYAGRAAESGPTREVLRAPAHPYTRLLLAARPGVDVPRGATLAEIPGIVPQPGALPRGCRFAPRCPIATRECETDTPPPVAVGHGHDAACIHVERR
jgi:peptide/nickel transport system ATP-binding protein